MTQSMGWRRWASGLALAAMLAGCGGDDGGAPSSLAVATPTPSPTATAACGVRDRQEWAAAQLREWYLFPDTLPASLDPSGYASVGAYIDALTATARGQRKDRYFTYVTSIAEENAYYNSGSSAGFGFRISADATTRRVFVSEAFEGAPALAAGIDRGAEITGIGTDSATLRAADAIIAAEGTGGITAALGPSTAGTARVIRFIPAGGGTERTVAVAKADYTLTPVSSHYGYRIIEDGGRRVGYLNLRTFINTAESALRAAFAQFRAAGITEVIVDLRYNGGGLVSLADLMGDLMGANRASTEVLSYTSYRSEKASRNSTRLFRPQPESIAPLKLAFIGTGGTASASELVINAFVPYLRGNAALIGTNTYGKPVGQIALDRDQCDDRLRVVAFATQNANRQGDYYGGLATTVEASCQAADELAYPLGDPREASVRAALSFLNGTGCQRISADAGAQAASARRRLLTPDQPSTAQREVPGLF